MRTRQPIITVLGHVDHGKTTFLDKVRGSTVAEREAGGITQHIGATEVPTEAIKEISGDLLKKYGFELKIPGLLFIDTPGHEAFTNLRKRGGNIADLAVLVIDVMQGCQNQTYEAIDILKGFKVPFIVVANKIDMLQGWNSQEKSIGAGLKVQSERVLNELNNRIYTIVGNLHSKGFSSERFDQVEDFTKQIPIIPVSSKTGEGIPEVLMFLAGLSQRYLEGKLSLEGREESKATILEVKEEKGLGTTIDVILYEGTLNVGDVIVLGGKKGVIETKIRALLKPKPLSEMRDTKEKFSHVDSVDAASGVKISAPNLDDALAGAPLLAKKTGEEAKIIEEELKSIAIETAAVGPIVKADTLGSLEALVKMLKDKELVANKAEIGDVTKKDIMEIISIKEADPLKGVIIAFNVEVPKDLADEMDKKEIKYFQEKIIYRIFENYDKWVQEMKDKEKKALLQRVVYPAKLQVLPNCIFRNSKPAIVGVKILMGKIKKGITLLKDGKELGTVNAIQDKGNIVEEAKKNDEVAISIDDAIVGRNLFEKDVLVAKIPASHIIELEKLGELTDEEKELVNYIKGLQKEEKQEE